MASLLRSTALIARASIRTGISTRISYQYQPARLAHGSYGNSQSGHPKSDAPNPQVDKEHPGPTAPADTGAEKSSPSSQGSPESTGEGSNSTPSSSPSEKSASDKSTHQTTSSGAKPSLGSPNDKPETSDPEVKKHNEDMRKRADQTPNQVK
jgi:hypothetical protein